MSAGLKLYVDFVSQPCRSLYIILKKSNIQFEKVLISLGKGEQLTKEYKDINRFQKVPCITEGDFKLAESGAILRYLDSTHRVSDNLYGNNNKEKRASIDEFLQWQYVLRKECFNLFHLDWIAPFRTGKLASKNELDEAIRDMEKIFDEVENIWLNTSKFVTGNEITVGDIFGATTVHQTILSNYVVEKKYPKIAEWIENVRRETNPHYDDCHKVLYKMIQTRNFK